MPRGAVDRPSRGVTAAWANSCSDPQPAPREARALCRPTSRNERVSWFVRCCISVIGPTDRHALVLPKALQAIGLRIDPEAGYHCRNSANCGPHLLSRIETDIGNGVARYYTFEKPGPAVDLLNGRTTPALLAVLPGRRGNALTKARLRKWRKFTVMYSPAGTTSRRAVHGEDGTQIRLQDGPVGDKNPSGPQNRADQAQPAIAAPPSSWRSQTATAPIGPETLIRS